MRPSIVDSVHILDSLSFSIYFIKRRYGHFACSSIKIIYKKRQLHVLLNLVLYGVKYYFCKPLPPTEHILYKFILTLTYHLQAKWHRWDIPTPWEPWSCNSLPRLTSPGTGSSRLVSKRWTAPNILNENIYVNLTKHSWFYQLLHLCILSGRHSIVGTEINGVILLCSLLISNYTRQNVLSLYFISVLRHRPGFDPASVRQNYRLYPWAEEEGSCPLERWSHLPPPSLTLVSIIQPVVYIWCYLSYYSSMSNLWSVSKLCLYFSELEREWIFIIIFPSLQPR